MPSKKQKGAAFERESCMLLSHWTVPGRKDIYWRTAMSGGRSTVHAKRHGSELAKQVGDICATAPEGAALLDWFVFELKFYRDLQWSQAIYEKGSSVILKAWRKLVKLAESVGRFPVLIAKQNAKTTFWITSRAGAKKINDQLPTAARLTLADRTSTAMYVFKLATVMLYPCPQPKD